MSQFKIETLSDVQAVWISVPGKTLKVDEITNKRRESPFTAVVTAHNLLHQMIELNKKEYDKRPWLFDAAILYTNSLCVEELKHEHELQSNLTDNEFIQPNDETLEEVRRALRDTAKFASQNVAEFEKLNPWNEIGVILASLGHVHNMTRYKDNTPSGFTITPRGKLKPVTGNKMRSS